jgi:hypothetical protein
MSHRLPHSTEGPFRAEQLRPGDPYELANGHPVECLPAGGRHAKASLTGGLALSTDPEVEEAGVDAGYVPDDKNLRAPDIAVGNVPDESGWVPGVPPLAVEYADAGQDEGDLREKIATLLAAGTRCVWVVRMQGPRRVEVHEPGSEPRMFGPGDTLEAPGILRNPVAVEALYDPAAAQAAALRNLLQRHGYADLDAVRTEGQSQGELTIVLRQLERRLVGLSAAQRDRISRLSSAQVEALGDALLDFREPDDLTEWLDRYG